MSNLLAANGNSGCVLVSQPIQAARPDRRRRLEPAARQILSGVDNQQPRTANTPCQAMSKPSDAGQAIAERLAEQIRRDGPITFYDWMLAALYDAHDGYYLRSDLERWGREGDYRTSPETSALFAATFARYFA